MKTLIASISLLALAACAQPQSSTVASADQWNGAGQSTEEDGSVYVADIAIKGTANGSQTSATLAKQSAAGDTSKLATFANCPLENGAPDMFADLTWEVCANSKYNVEVDNPSPNNTGYIVTLTLVGNDFELGVLFTCTQSQPSDLADELDLHCVESGHQQPIQPL